MIALRIPFFTALRAAARRALFFLALAPLYMSAPALRADDRPLARKGSFTLEIALHWSGGNYALEEGHIHWVGAGKGVALNRTGSGLLHQASVLVPSYADIRGTSVEVGGHCRLVDADGDKVFCRIALRSAQGGAGATIEGIQGSVEFTSGTGKYKGITGKAKAAYRDVALRESGEQAEGEGVYTWEGQWQLP